MIPGNKKYKSVTLIANIGAILILPIASYEISIAAPKVIAQQVTSQKSAEQLQTLAKSITVKVLSGENTGSGTLIRKQNGVYTVLTNQHVIENGASHQIQTPDGKTYQAQTVPGANFDSNDMALLQFNGSQNYTVASLGNLKTVEKGSPIFVAGFPFEPESSDTNGFIFQTGRISFVLQQPLEGGYLIGYTANVEKGMSGGPILNSQGEVIGINGIFAQALSFSHPYIYEDGTRPNDNVEAQMRRSSWGVPIDKLAQLAPQFAPDNSVPVAVEKPSTEAIATLAEKVNGIAQQVSVLITRSDVENGSGVIIAKEGNTYYVLSAGHVANGKGLKVVTHDGQEYVVDSSKVKNWKNKGLDLALLEFTSNQSYQVATIGDYPRGIEDRVAFLSGWPASKQPTAANLELGRQFNAGYLSGISGFNSANDERSFISGFGLVYGNFSEKGMSGGPVLDTEGRLIGIHTAAESVEGDESPVLQRDSEEPILEVGHSLGVPIRTFLAKLEQEKIKLNINQQTSLPQRLDSATQDLVISKLIKLQEPQSNATAVEWLNYGNKLWRLRRYKRSLAAFEQAISIKPDFYLAWYSHGWTLMRQGNYPEAIKSFKDAIKYAENLPESEYKYRALSQAWRQKSDAHFYSGQYKESLQALEQAIEYTPNDFILYQWKREILKNLGFYQEALEAVDLAIKIDPNNSYGYFRRAWARVELEDFQTVGLNKEEKDYEEAIADINKALELNPGNSFYYTSKGSIYTRKENYAQAIEYFNKAIEAEPDFAIAYAQRGLFYAKQGNRQKFAEDLEKALRLQPDNAGFYRIRGNGYFALKEKQKGIDDYDKAISINPRAVHQYHNLRGKQFEDLGDYEAALLDFSKAIELKPDGASYYSDRGRAYSDRGNYEAALADYNKAIELSSENALSNALFHQSRGSVFFSRGLVLHYKDYDYEAALKEYEAALADYHKAIELKPDVGLFYNSRGAVLGLKKDYEAALADYNKAIELEPDNALFYHSRADVFLEQKEYAAALADYSKAIELKPDRGLTYINRGNTYFKIGEKQKGIDDYDKAISLDSELAHQYYNWRGFQLFEQKDYEAALADFNKAIELKPDVASFYNGRWLIYFEQEKYQEAIADSTEAIRLQPEQPIYYSSRATAYYENEEYKKSHEDFKKAATLYQNQQQENTEMYKIAVGQMEKIQRFPKYYRELGNELYEQKDYEAAIKDYTLGLSQASGGIGADFDQTELRGKLGWQITEVLKNYPAFNANLKSGDIILEADGKLFLSDNSETLFNFLYNYIGGEVGTEVTLKILRGTEEFTVTVVRDLLDQDEIAELHYQRGLAYLQIGNNQKAGEDFQKAATLYQQQENTQGYQTAMEQLEKIQEQ
ncbi:MAG: tetratricopeptide repeat protein [Okeania sp. SIO3B3]|nr:tetratricopeptide repeat protein [Okeania sp. SIO3B3]